VPRVSADSRWNGHRRRSRCDNEVLPGCWTLVDSDSTRSRAVGPVALGWSWWRLVDAVLLASIVIIVGAWTWVFWLFWGGAPESPPRALTVQVDPTLTADRAWHPGKFSLGSGRGSDPRAEVTCQELEDGRVHVLSRESWGPYSEDVEFWLTFPSDGTPIVEVQSRGYEESEAKWPFRNVGGIVRLSSEELRIPGNRRVEDSTFILAYDLVFDDCGSDAQIEGKLAFRPEDL
jgi:hypothetical protein